MASSVLVHFPDLREPLLKIREATPKVGDEFPDGHVVTRVRVVSGGECEIWVKLIRHTETDD